MKIAALQFEKMNMNRREVLGGAAIAAVATVGGAAAFPPISRAVPGFHAGLFNVDDFGAAGDGSADDTDALQNAINAAVSAGGGQVLLNAGEYKLTRTVTLGSGVDLAGIGSNSVLRPTFSERPPNRVIDNDWVNGNSNISLRNFKLDRSGANVQHGILLNGVDNLLIDGIEVSGTPSVRSGCISISAIGPDTRLLSKNIRVVNCHFAQTGNFGVQPGYVDGCIMANNTAYEADREVFAIEPEAGTSGKNVVISGNAILGNNTIDGSATGLIIATTSSGGTIDGVTITGNTLNSLQPEAANPGILILGASGVSISGNAIYRMPGAGILIGNTQHATTGVVISGNTITDCARSGGSPGIQLRNANHCVVTGNYIYGTNHSHSVLEQLASADNLISNNVLRDNEPVGTPSTGTAVFNNKSTDNDAALVFGTSYAMNRRVVAGNYAIVPSDYLVAVTDTSSAATITLPRANTTNAGAVYVVKDESGDAASKGITINGTDSDTIDGASSITISTNYASVSLYSTGTSWATI